MVNTPILYSHRHCPYCLRAHMALKYAGLKILLRDVELSDLPAEALAVSQHATVPSLVITENEYLDESWDIVKWAVRQNDPENWFGVNNEFLQDAEMLVETTDYSFKADLDNYKHANRHSEHTLEYHRQRGEEFLDELNELLEKNQYLFALHITVADIVVFPFVREFALVDKDWFDKSPYLKLQHWLDAMLDTEWFRAAFKKQETWRPDSQNVYL